MPIRIWVGTGSSEPWSAKMAVRHHLHHQHDDHHDGHDQHEDRVDQRAAHLALHLALLGVVLADGIEGGVQAAGFLAGAHGLQERDREQLAPPLGEGRGQRAAALHVLGHLLQYPLERLVGHLVGDQLHGAGDGDAGPEDDRELAAHQREGLVVELVAADVQAHELGQLAPGLDLGELGDDGIVLLDLRGGVQVVEGLDDAGNLLAVPGDGGVFIGGHYALLL